MNEAESGGPGECGLLCGDKKVPSDDELVALNAMRGIKNRVRDLKRRLTEISSCRGEEHTEEIAAIEKEMAQLKVEWNAYEKRRKKAAKERMIRLGHEAG
jgi:hypothetical protein